MVRMKPAAMRIQLRHRLKRGDRANAFSAERDVAVEAALRLTRLGRCYACGGLVEAVLAELGSPRCHDCRSSALH